jgi:uncharacterized protein YlxP (DUF503 family)
MAVMKKEPEFKKIPDTESINPQKKKKYVYPVRDWKEYLGESFMIIFSVILALALTEYISKVHEKENTKTLMRSIVDELHKNKKAIAEMQEYDLQVLANIDTALIDRERQKRLVSHGEFHLQMIAPQGALFRYFEEEAWTIAKNNNIMSKIDIESITTLTRVYEDQSRITKVEDEIAKVIFDRASRDPKQVRTTLILMRDIYHAWAVDRIPGLFSEIDSAVVRIEKFSGTNQ